MENLNISNYNYDAIKYFISVARQGSLSRAATSLGISQSALSQSMKNLEQSLGVTLFNRNSRGIILTEEGKVLYENAIVGDEYFKNAIVETIREKSFSELKTFKISISSSLTSLLITPIIRHLQEEFPKINFEISRHISENEIVESLQSGKNDLVVLKNDKSFIIKEVIMEKLMEMNYVFVYNPMYIQVQDNITFDELSNYPIVMKERTGRNDNSWIKTSFNRFICCRSDRQCLEMIRAGAGIGVYPKELAKKESLNILSVKDFKPTKRIVNAFYINSNTLAKDIVMRFKALK